MTEPYFCPICEAELFYVIEIDTKICNCGWREEQAVTTITITIEEAPTVD